MEWVQGMFSKTQGKQWKTESDGNVFELYTFKFHSVINKKYVMDGTT